MIIFIAIMSVIFLLMIVAVIHAYVTGKEKKNPMLNHEVMADNNRMIQFNELQGRKPLQQFLNQYPEYQKETLEKDMAEVSEHLISLTEDSRISPTMLRLMEQNTKRKKLLEMQCQRTNLLSFKDGMLYTIAVYANNKEEYVLSMRFKMKDAKLYLFAYDVTIGSKTNLVSK